MSKKRYTHKEKDVYIEKLKLQLNEKTEELKATKTTVEWLEKAKVRLNDTIQNNENITRRITSDSYAAFRKLNEVCPKRKFNIFKALGYLKQIFIIVDKWLKDHDNKLEGNSIKGS